MATKVPTDPNMTPEIRAFLEKVQNLADTTSSSLTSTIAALPALATQAQAEAGVENTAYMSALRTAQAIAALAPTPVFTKSFTSTAQTVSAAGGLTLAHSMGVTPTLIQCRLVCTSTDAGYAVNDEIVVSTQAGDNTNTGIAVWPDATNINVRFGSAATTSIQYMHKTTGALTALTDTKWNFIVRAWA